jgi:hypothetical protein
MDVVGGGEIQLLSLSKEFEPGEATEDSGDGGGVNRSEMVFARSLAEATDSPKGGAVGSSLETTSPKATS